MIATVSIGLVGCSDFLVREPKLKQSNELTLATYDGLNSAVAGAYSRIAESGWYGQSWIIDAEMRSGNGVKDQVRNSNRCVTPYTWNYTPDNTSGIWSYCYVLCAEVNNVIDNLAGKADGVEVTDQDLGNLEAECLFLRAFSLFHCVLTYAQPYSYNPDSPGVPVVLHTDPEGKPARETVAKVYERITADLLRAESIIDPEYVRRDGTDPKSYVNIDVIRAFLSRVYLHMEKWQKAADYASLVIGSGNYEIWTSVEYPDVWGREIAGEGGEVIFEVYGKRTNDAFASWEDLSYLTSSDGSGDPMASKDLLSLYGTSDLRRTSGYRTITDKNPNNRHWTTKYSGKGDVEGDAADCNNVIILRLSEMYLNRAEAIANGAVIDGVTVESDLTAIRSMRNSADNATDLAAVKKERRLELAWEGHYIYDLARWNQSLNRTDYTLGSNANKDIPFPDYRWALPVPQRERNVNGNLVQNEGYSNN